MEVLILLTLLIALDLAAWRWGHDSRDGHDWKILSSTEPARLAGHRGALTFLEALRAALGNH